MVRKLALITLCLLALGLSARDALAIQWTMDMDHQGGASVNDLAIVHIYFYNANDVIIYDGAMAMGPDWHFTYGVGIPENAVTWQVYAQPIQGFGGWFEGNPSVKRDVNNPNHWMGMTIHGD